METNTLIDPTILTTNPPVSSDIPAAEKVERENEDLFDYSKAKTRATQTITAWDNQVTKPAGISRNIRTIEIDIDSLHRTGELKVDETIIPIRVVDSNIKAEQPAYISYVKQSRRLAIFKCLENKQIDQNRKQVLEQAFTDSLTYIGWERWVYDTLDAAQLHGWCCVEVEFDETKPGHVGVVYHPHEDVIFNIKARELEFQPWIAIRISLPFYKFQSIAKAHGFDHTQIKLVEDRWKEKENTEDVKLYKFFFKSEGIQVAWALFDDNCDKWLKEPKPLYLGRTEKRTVQVPSQTVDPLTGMPMMAMQPQTTFEPVFEKMYPINLLKYQETEERVITETKGRAFLDLAKQDANTALYSAFVNSAVRASNVYGSPKQGTGKGRVEQLDIELAHGCIYSEPLEFWSTAFPSFDLIRGAQALDVKTQQETGKIAAATMAREDSRKLAKEMEIAQQTDEALSSVQLVNFSIFLTEVYTHSWAIMQSRALAGKIPFAVNDIGQNDEELLSYTYQLKPAGDQDVVRRIERIKAKKELWPIISVTPLAAPFLLDLIKDILPEDAEKYEQMYNQYVAQQQMQQQVAPEVPQQQP